MKIAVISFTTEGRRLAGRLTGLLREEGHSVTENVKGAAFAESVPFSVTEWAGRNFKSQDALVFVGAAGIAVRAVSPWIQAKTSDAAVLVLDERGNYCIPLLSGHIGGANELALFISERLPAVPVITTATDIQGKWAADVFAVKNKLLIKDMEKAKQTSAKVLAGKRLLLLTDADEVINGERYADSLDIRRCEEIKEAGSAEEAGKGVAGERDALDVYIGYAAGKAREEALCLIPRAVTAGIGCRRGTGKEAVCRAVEETLKRAGIFRESLEAAASIDLKKDEQGILDYCKDEGLSFFTYSKEELLAAEGTFTGSEFVEQITGVDNVCERSALVHSGGRLIVKKQVYDGITVALAVRKWSVSF